MSTEPLLIARCPEHGLHGARSTCFICGAPVEQVPMVPAEVTPGHYKRDGSLPSGPWAALAQRGDRLAYLLERGANTGARAKKEAIAAWNSARKYTSSYSVSSLPIPEATPDTNREAVAGEPEARDAMIGRPEQCPICHLMTVPGQRHRCPDAIAPSVVRAILEEANRARAHIAFDRLDQAEDTLARVCGDIDPPAAAGEPDDKATRKALVAARGALADARAALGPEHPATLGVVEHALGLLQELPQFALRSADEAPRG